MKIAAGIALFVAVAAAGVVAFIYSGVYNIGATSPHLDITVKVLRTAVEQSVKRQARNVTVPELDDPEKVHNGFKNFGEMCAICHGAAGKPASSAISKGLYPEAPDLAEAVKGWTPAELYEVRECKRAITRHVRRVALGDHKPSPKSPSVILTPSSCKRPFPSSAPT